MHSILSTNLSPIHILIFKIYDVGNEKRAAEEHGAGRRASARALSEQVTGRS